MEKESLDIMMETLKMIFFNESELIIWYEGYKMKVNF